MWIKTSKQYREETSRKISWGHWFAFFNILWAIILGARYAFIMDWPDTLFGKLYFFISLFGHFSFVVFALYLLFIFPLSFLIKNDRTFRGITVILTTIGATLLLVDSEVFSRFNLHLSTVVWNLLVNPENGELSRTWQIFFAPMPLILLVQMVFSRWSWQKLRSLERQKWLKGVGVFFVCTFIATHLIYAWADAFIYRPITMQRSNFPLSYPMTARSFLEKHGFLDKQEYDQIIEQQGRLDALKINYPKQKLTFATSQTPNMVLITVSGLRHDAIDEKHMPHLTAFANQSTQFTNHYSSGNDNNTGLTGLFYGLSAHYVDSLLSNKTASILVEKLKQEHYELGLFSSTQFHSSLFRQALFPTLSLATRNTSNQLETARFKTWFAQIKDKNTPFAAYLSLNIRPNLAKADYQLELAEIDRLLGTILPEIELNKTLVVITAEHGYHFKPLNAKALLHYFGRDEIQVPMVIHWKDLPAGEVSNLTSHMDLLPAVMKHIFHAQNPISDYSQGRDLFQLTQPADWVLVSNYRWNVIVTPDGTQYHIDKRGTYQKYNQENQKESSDRPPLGLFLEVFNQERSFIEK
ncbi:DUF3413 domain-containing protein [Pasteurella multocida]|uniref:DUF3413 domain-containing protein n=1 Tax=Pasteurella multocida TaxID=747 RepID=UPI00286E4D12|nr:DUF3413 domain-containing protein [Pasteurella multocida]